jgi:hypothetical protein
MLISEPEKQIPHFRKLSGHGIEGRLQIGRRKSDIHVPTAPYDVDDRGLRGARASTRIGTGNRILRRRILRRACMRQPQQGKQRCQQVASAAQTIGDRSFVRNQAEPLRDQHQLQSARGTQLLLDRRLVIGCGLGAEAQALADFLHVVPLGQHPQHLELPRR